MKISILSMQRVNNYGSFLQAYALKTVLENQNHKVDFIDVICKEEVKSSNKNNLLKKLKKVDRYLIKNIKFRKKEKKIREIILEYQKKFLDLPEKYVYETSADAVVIGSDEVFNCDPKCAWGVSSQLFGDVKNCDWVISYAACCGYTKFEDLNEHEKTKIREAIKKLKYISVRDRNTREFIEKISGREITENLDPVFIYDFEKEVENAEKNMDFSEKYMIVYAYRNRIHDKKEIRAIKEYAKKNKLKIYCVQGMLPWCDEYKEWNPFEVLAGFKNAECIVTDTFHGCVIAAKYNKKFGVLIRESNRNKIADLLSRLNLEDHDIKSVDEIAEKLCKNYNYEKFNECIEIQRKKTNEYLLRSLRK